MPTIRPISAELAEEISQFQRSTAVLLNFSLDASPGDIVAKIKEHVGELRDKGAQPTEDDVAGLAVVVGGQYVRQFNWCWKEVNFGDDGLEEHFAACVLSPDGSIALTPVWKIYNILAGEQDNTLLLTFNMVAANVLPVAPPGAALIIG